MNHTNRFWQFVFFTMIATLLIISGILFFFYGALNQEQVVAVISIEKDYPLYIIGIFFICAGVVFTGLQIIFHTYIKPLKKISAEAAMIYSTNPSHRLSIHGNKDIKILSGVINDFADMFENLNKNITEQILVARDETEKERNLLAAIMAELPQGVIICNKNGRILLFNSLAKKIFTQGTHSNRPDYFIGLGRSIFHLIDKALIFHAIHEIQEHLKHKRQSVASYFMTPIHGNHLISVETIPVLDPEKKMTGFILTFHDVTEDIHQYDRTHETLTMLKKDLANHMGRVKALLTSPHEICHIPLPEQDQLIKTIDSLPLQYEQVTEHVLDVMLTKLPLTHLASQEVLSSLKEKLDSLYAINLNIPFQTDNNRILADTYSFTTALVSLLKNLSDITLTTEFNISTLKKNDTVHFTITWQNTPIKKKQINALLSNRINALPSLFYILKQNHAVLQTICQSHEDCYGINIITQAESKRSVKEKQRSPIIAGSRPEFYDFNLFRTEDENLDLLDTNLKNIIYTVFDTETTGLNPEGGDEIISIAAVRIVNQKIVYKDIFEELVDPNRDIPMESYKIHGITYEMVAGKKDINTILPIFKNFSSSTVLVGHNIAFDMKMLKVKEKTTHIKFSNPVLDTLLLSAILHPVHEQHDMENIAKRLGVSIIGRHTALGDTIATAEIFLKLIPILNSNGILTLKDAIKASKKTYYARLKY